MRRLILFANTSLDGFVGGPGGEMGWMVDDESMDHDFTTDIRARAGTILAGRVLYESFAGAWPAMRHDPSLSPGIATFADWMNETPIVVVSRTLAPGTPLAMPNARLAARPLAEEVAALKAAPGGDADDLVVFGGASTVSQLVGLGLVDEYWFKVQPVVLGRGLPVFDRLAVPADLALTWSRVYPSGVLGVRYDTVARPEAVVRSRYVDPSDVVRTDLVPEEA